MKLIFIHNGPVFYDKNGIYYEYSYHNLYERYSYMADEISFIMRTYPIKETKEYTKIPQEVSIISVPNLMEIKGYISKRNEAKKIIENEISKADILVLRGGIYSDIALKYAKRHNIPYIYECVGCIWDSLWNYNYQGKLLAPFSFLSTRNLIRNSPYVYYVTEKFLQKRYPSKGKQIGCSDVVIEEGELETLSKRLRKIKLLDKKSTIVLGTAAAIDVRYKGQEYVIRAISRLRKMGYNIKYLLAGGNRANSSFIQNLAKKLGVLDCITYVGSLNFEKIIDFYDSIDIYIQPSKTEGLPRAVIEAMSRGCPVLGSDIAGIPELIDKECLFRKGNDKSIADSIIKMLNSDMTKYAKQNFEKAQNYTVDILNEKRNRFYDEFLADNINN